MLIDGENAGEEALREAERFVISDLQFQDFLERHSSVTCLVPESNEKVRSVQTNCGMLMWASDGMLQVTSAEMLRNSH